MKRRGEQIVKELTALDDTMFHKLVESKDFCEELLEVILGKKIRLLKAEPQKSLRNVDGRSVVLDVYCVDEAEANYNVEIQNEDNDDHQKRARYNTSNMDTYISEKGTKFKELPDIYVIYISRNDFFKCGKTVYYVNRVLSGLNKVVNNGVHEIYVNTEIDDGTDLAELMKIFKSAEVPGNEKFPRICSEIQNVKVGKGSDHMCRLVEEYAQEVAAEAVEAKEKEAREAIEKEAREKESELAREMFTDGFSFAMVKKYLKILTEEEVHEIQDSVE